MTTTTGTAWPSAPDPRTWLEVDLEAHDAYHDEDHAPEPGERRLLTRADLLADDAAALRETHARLRADATTAQAAATYLAGWYAGAAATVVGVGLATARAGFLLDPAAVRWRVVPEGWPERTLLDAPRVLVAPGHRWAERSGVEVVADPDDLLTRTVSALVAFATPIVHACTQLAKVKPVKLWDEVADGMACALSHRLEPVVTPDMIDVLDRAVRVPGTPWRNRARLELRADPLLGTVHIAQKGGCCLAFTNPRGPLPPIEELDEDQRAWRERFPPPETGKRYCGTCTFRPAAECDERQLFWLHRHAERRATG